MALVGLMARAPLVARLRVRVAAVEAAVVVEQLVQLRLLPQEPLAAITPLVPEAVLVGL